MNILRKIIGVLLFFLCLSNIQSQCITGLKVYTFGGDSIVYSCEGVHNDIVSFKSFTANTPALYIITDHLDTIRRISFTSKVNFIGLNDTEYHVYGASYKPPINNVIGQDLKTAKISNLCLGLSTNHVVVYRQLPPVPSIKFEDQTTEKLICDTDQVANKLKFNFEGPADLHSIFLLTDSTGLILDTFVLNEVDLNSFKDNTYRIYVVLYSGTLSIPAGQSIFTTLLSTECFSISAKPLIIYKSQVKAGKIKFENGKDSVLICPDQDLSFLKFKSELNLSFKFVYILSTVQDTIIRVLPGDTVDLKKSLRGVCKIWGLAYSGDLNLNPGDYINKPNRSTGCSDLSSNPLTLIKDQAIGGRVSLLNGDSTYHLCYKDGWPDYLALRTNSPSPLPYLYIATDKNNLILGVTVSSSDLEFFSGIVSRIYGVSYQGSIVAKPGDDITKVPFAIGCFSISTNYITISTEEIAGGIIRVNKNIDLIQYCFKSNIADTLRLNSNGSTNGSRSIYIGIQSDTIKFISTTGVILRSMVPVGSTDIFGIAYKGNFLVKSGDKLSASRLVDSCYGVSSNSIRIENFNPLAGTVSSNSGLSDIYLCPGDGQSDIVSMSRNGAVPLPYGYFVTNKLDSILAFTTESNIELDTFPLGLCKIYGVSYTGDIQYKNKNIKSPDLASECFDISANAINVFKSLAEGGKISLSNGDTIIDICVEDLGSDTLKFNHTLVNHLKYAYLLTDTANRFQGIIEENELHDFNGSDAGICRVYGIAYGGILTILKNDDITKAVLSSGCHDLSDNYVTINKSNVGSRCKNITGGQEKIIIITANPNPAKNFIKVGIKSKYLKTGNPVLTLMAASGGGIKKIILDNQSVDNEEAVINTSDLTPGLYFIMFKNGYIFDNLKIIIIK
ncbi:MAG: hypothetical protein ABIR66_13190 [Saprospiraceae bacterium]